MALYTMLSTGIQQVVGPGRSAATTSKEVILQTTEDTFFKVGNSTVVCSDGTNGHFLAAGSVFAITIVRGQYIYTTAGTLYISPIGMGSYIK